MLPSRDVIAQVLGVLANFFPAFSRQQSADAWTGMIAAYHLVLYDVPADLLERAALDLGARATFFPSAGELRKAAFDLLDLGHDVPTAQDAWAEVSRRLRRGFYRLDECGAYQRRQPTAEDWSHPLIQRAIDGIGGWLALTDPQALATADRARFIEAYNVYATRERQTRDMLPCVREAVAQIRASSQGQPLPLQQIVRRLTAGGAPVVDLAALGVD